MDSMRNSYPPFVNPNDFFYGEDTTWSSALDLTAGEGIPEYALCDSDMKLQHQEQQIPCTLPQAIPLESYGTTDIMSWQSFLASDDKRENDDPPLDCYMQSLLDYTPELISHDETDMDPMFPLDDCCLQLSPANLSSYLDCLEDSPNTTRHRASLMDKADPFVEQRKHFGLAASLPMSFQGCHWSGDFAYGTTFDPPLEYHGSFQEPITHDLLGSHDGGLTREYVSLSDVNSFVAEADSQKQIVAMHQSFSTPDCLGLSENDSNAHFLTSFTSVPASLAACTQQHWDSPQLSDGNEEICSSQQDSDSETTCSSQSWLHQAHATGGFSGWAEPAVHHSAQGCVSSRSRPKNTTSKSNSTRKRSLKKPTSVILTLSGTSKARSRKRDDLTRRKSKASLDMPRALNDPKTAGCHSGMTRSLSTSESISTRMARQRLSDDEDDYNLDDAAVDRLDEEEDEDDDDYVFRTDNHLDEDDDAYTFHVGAPSSTYTTQSTSSMRKGRNVDKACNHCKRSHLRCDNMRPCRRCIATGKTGCKDVEHKPRGRPRLNKNQVNAKKESQELLFEDALEA